MVVGWLVGPGVEKHVRTNHSGLRGGPGSVDPRKNGGHRVSYRLEAAKVARAEPLPSEKKTGLAVRNGRRGAHNPAPSSPPSPRSHQRVGHVGCPAGLEVIFSSLFHCFHHGLEQEGLDRVVTGCFANTKLLCCVRPIIVYMGRGGSLKYVVPLLREK